MALLDELNERGAQVGDITVVDGKTYRIEGRKPNGHYKLVNLTNPEKKFWTSWAPAQEREVDRILRASFVEV